jgi:hypothetical protein
MILVDIGTLTREMELVIEISVGLNTLIWLLARED